MPNGVHLGLMNSAGGNSTKKGFTDKSDGNRVRAVSWLALTGLRTDSGCDSGIERRLESQEWVHEVMSGVVVFLVVSETLARCTVDNLTAPAMATGSAATGPMQLAFGAVGGRPVARPRETRTEALGIPYPSIP